MFDPPVCTPISRIMRIEAVRRVWYCLSERVCAGATVTESPVWMPMGSTFSMEQTMTTLSARSRMTSSSNSFQPATLFSTRALPTGLASRPSATARRSSRWSAATEPPLPPRVKLGRTIRGNPILSASSSASVRLRTVRLSGTLRPMRSIASWKSWRSSALRIDSIEAPSISTPTSSRTPRSSSSTARFSAVWPPRVGSSASGRSRRMISATASAVRGST